MPDSQLKEKIRSQNKQTQTHTKEIEMDKVKLTTRRLKFSHIKKVVLLSRKSDVPI